MLLFYIIVKLQLCECVKLKPINILQLYLQRVAPVSAVFSLRKYGNNNSAIFVTPFEQEFRRSISWCSGGEGFFENSLEKVGGMGAGTLDLLI